MNPTAAPPTTARPQRFDDPVSATVPAFTAGKSDASLSVLRTDLSMSYPVPTIAGDADRLGPVSSALTAERDRIAVAVGNNLVNQMFAISLDLHAALSLLGAHQDTPAAAKIRLAVDGLDEAVNDLRATIFDLRIQ
jgi:signal transduction histidine kinase